MLQICHKYLVLTKHIQPKKKFHISCIQHQEGTRVKNVANLLQFRKTYTLESTWTSSCPFVDIAEETIFNTQYILSKFKSQKQVNGWTKLSQGKNQQIRK